MSLQKFTLKINVFVIAQKLYLKTPLNILMSVGFFRYWNAAKNAILISRTNPKN